MIIVRLMGGLGNQMFQYAFAYALSQKNETQLKIDTTLLEDRNKPDEIVTHRDLLLDKVFNVTLDVATINEIEYFNGKKYNHLIGKIYNKVSQVLRKPMLVIEKSRGFHSEYLMMSNHVCLVGAFQCEKYFKSYDDSIKQLFSFKNPVLEISYDLVSKIKTENSVAIHVRRGDYVTSPLYSKTIGALPINYYLEAIKLIQEKIDNPVFYIFSDDINWCKHNFKSEKYSFCFVDDEHAGTHASNYLQILTKCKHYIISNSTFSWWGAWLSDNNDKIVIAPKKWFLDESLDSKDIVPENWIRL